MPLVTVRAAAERLGVGYSTMKRWIASGHVRSTRTEGGHHRISDAEIERLLARQQQGAQTNMNFADNLNRALRYLGEVLIDLAPKIYDRPGRVVQVIGADDEVRKVMLGQPFQQGAQGEPEAAPEGVALVQGLHQFYDLSKGQYAVTVTIGHSYTTRRQEAVASMLELVNAQPALAPLISDVLVENMDWPGAPKLAARLKKMLPPPLQEQKGGQPSPEQLQQQLMQMGMQLEQLQQVAQQQAEELKTKKFETDSKERVSAADRESKERIAVLQAQTQQLIAAMKTAGDQQEAKLQAQIDLLSQQMGVEADLLRNRAQLEGDLLRQNAQTQADLAFQERDQASDHLKTTRELAFQAQNAHTAAAERAATPPAPPET
jgi:excisionase family DNA binding protein